MTTGIEILDNAFFGFWYCFSDYFFAIFAMAIFVSIVIALIYLTTQR